MRRDHWELPFRLRLPDAWVARAACAGMEAEVFFPGRGGDPSSALAVCEVCPVTAACLDYALANCERFGVWGGTTEKERRSLKQRSRRSAVVPMEGRRRNGHHETVLGANLGEGIGEVG